MARLNSRDVHEIEKRQCLVTLVSDVATWTIPRAFYTWQIYSDRPGIVTLRIRHDGRVRHEITREFSVHSMWCPAAFKPQIIEREIKRALEKMMFTINKSITSHNF